ncbi:calcium-binding protein [uncultured Roseobacter sp.]|uniref:calcium-binding protein n=1 Tax=uncultured Roseobacter sp. TaxID=114847 RepID=UPI00263032B6|nr:calcium-binding protein [uncultured Roseobacter sp.]
MATPTEWLNEFQVNTGAAATGGQSNPQIIGLNNGGFVVAWVEASSGTIAEPPAGQDIVAKVFDAEGNVVKDSFRLNVFGNADDERDFDLVATHDGFAMAYVKDYISATNQTQILYERFDFEGVRQVGAGTAGSLALENVAADFLSDPQIAANLIASNDDLYVAYEDDVGTDTDISARIIDQNGALGAEFGSAQNSPDFDRLGDVTVLSNGNFVTAYLEDDAGTTSVEFTIRTETGATVGVNARFLASEGSEVNVSALEGGGFVAAYVFNGDVLFRTFDNAGALQDSGTVASGTNSQNEVVVQGLPDGGFVVAWDDDTSGDLFARRYNADGTSNGSQFTVENAATTQIDIGVTGDGRILFTWVANDGLGEIFASVWDPRDSVIDPSDYDVEKAHVLNSDVITTGLGGSTVLAGFGSKTVFGQGGNDIINASSGGGEYFGGGGNDIIFASNTAFETLDGGAGIDTLNTTLFNGTYEIDLETGVTNFAPESFVNFENVITGNGDTTVKGTAGNNIITTGSGNDTVNGGGGNDTINTGLGNDTIDGDAGNDTINAGGGDDTINGGTGNDTIFAGSGNDTVTASSGTDTVFGGLGNDTLFSSGVDTIFGEEGNDTIHAANGLPETLDGGTGVDTLITTSFGGNYVVDLRTGLTNFGGELFTNFENITSGAGNDELFGFAADNVMNGGAGNDRILAFNGNDTLIGGLGDDTLNGGEGNDNISGGDGKDTVFGQQGNDVINGGADEDQLFGEDGNDTINGGEGDDTIGGANGSDNIDGDGGNDEIFGGEGNDTVRGGTGNDRLFGNGGNDFVDGEDGDDQIFGETGADTLLGGDGADEINGGGGNDFMNGENGNDRMFGGSNDDAMFGGSGNDLMDGQQQDDDLFGQTGNDTMFGGDGFDLLDGGSGNDTLFGGNQGDTLRGGAGTDFMDGGAGFDTFDFNAVSESAFGSADTISGFDGAGAPGGDVIDVSGIDANTTAGGNQAFTFLGAVTSAVGLGFGAGALWVQEFGGQTRLYGEVNGDGVIDFEVRINDGPGTVAGDYTLDEFLL